MAPLLSISIPNPGKCFCVRAPGPDSRLKTVTKVLILLQVSGSQSESALPLTSALPLPWLRLHQHHWPVISFLQMNVPSTGSRGTWTQGIYFSPPKEVHLQASFLVYFQKPSFISFSSFYSVQPPIHRSPNHPPKKG